MMSLKQIGPEHCGGAAGPEPSGKTGLGQYTGRPRLAPYANRLDPHSHQSIAILTGSQAWKRGESRSNWFHGCRLLLPWHEPPEAFLWPIEARDCCLFSFGEPEPRGILDALSVELIHSGAVFVIWVNVPGDGTPATLYRPARRESAND